MYKNKHEEVSMSSEMTPMKRYSGGLSSLKHNLRSITFTTELNKSSPKYNSHNGRSKGVDSDYILIFKDKHSDASFALVFEYMGLTAEQQRVVGSVKMSDEDPIKNSFNMTLEEFKTSLNALNKDLEATRGKNMEFPEALSLFSRHMLKEVIDLASDLKSANSTISKFLTQKMKEVEAEGFDEKITTAEKALTRAEKAVKKKLADSPLTQERETLLARLAQIDKELKDEKQRLVEKADIAGKKQAVVDSKAALANKRAEIDRDVDVQLEKFPIAVRKRVKNNI